jgi:hypothetical protein
MHRRDSERRTLCFLLAECPFRMRSGWAVARRCTPVRRASPRSASLGVRARCRRSLIYPLAGLTIVLGTPRRQSRESPLRDSSRVHSRGLFGLPFVTIGRHAVTARWSTRSRESVRRRARCRRRIPRVAWTIETKIRAREVKVSLTSRAGSCRATERACRELTRPFLPWVNPRLRPTPPPNHNHQWYLGPLARSGLVRPEQKVHWNNSR